MDANYEEVYDYVKAWAESLERIVGAALIKRGVIISDRTKRNITVTVLRKTLSNVGIEISTRDALRFIDMGAGRGWHKGKRTSQYAYRKRLNEGANAKPRVKKIVFNKPIYKQIARLGDVVATAITEKAIDNLLKQPTRF